jgi:hypothetical protein
LGFGQIVEKHFLAHETFELEPNEALAFLLGQSSGDTADRGVEITG